MSAHALCAPGVRAPGRPAAHTRHLLAQAAGAHARLLDSAVAAGQTPLNTLRQAVGNYLRGPASATEKRFVLDDPQLVEALHELSPTSAVLTDWDSTVAPGCYHAPAERQASLGRGRLGNVVVAILLRQCHQWCGTVELATDAYGRVHLPFCDWALVLVDDCQPLHDLFAHQTLLLELDHHEACWSLSEHRDRPLVRMPRPVFDAMFVADRGDVRASGVQFAVGPLRARLSARRDWAAHGFASSRSAVMLQPRTPS